MWDWLNTNAGGLGAVAALIGTLATVITAWVAIRALRASEADSEERSRPVVTAELRPHPRLHGGVMLVVANRGPTMAHDVQVTFDPALDVPEDRMTTSMAGWIAKRYSRVIASLGPGQELSNMWRAIGVDDEPVHQQTTLTVRYSGRTGRRYEEAFTLDLDVLLTETVVGDTSSLEARAKEVVAQLKTLSRALQVMNTAGVKLRQVQSAEERQRVQENNESVMRALGRTGSDGDEAPADGSAEASPPQ